MRSIRRFLLAVVLTTVGVVTLAAAVYGYRNSVAEVEQLFDARLAEVAEVLAAAPPGFYRSATGDSAIAFQVWEGDELTAASANAPTAPITPLKPGFSDVKLGGFRWRAYVLQPDNEARWIVVAESVDIRLALADTIVLDSVWPVVLALPVLGLLVWLIISRGLQPLSLLASEMRRKRSDDLSPVTDLQPPSELAELVNAINDLLHRLDASIARERQFAADAAHELRTPISALKVELHNLERETRAAGGDWPQLPALHNAVARMGRSVEQLLTLQRLTPEQFAARLVPVDLAELARAAVATSYPVMAAREQQIELQGDADPVNGDAFALDILLTNLLENASRYGGTGGQIRVTLTTDTGGTRLMVEDDGPGIPAAQRQRVFERFYRGEHDSAQAGSGLGLAIVQNIVALHGAAIHLGESSFATGLAVTVAFPPAAAQQA